MYSVTVKTVAYTRGDNTANRAIKRRGEQPELLNGLLLTQVIKQRFHTRKEGKAAVCQTHFQQNKTSDAQHEISNQKHASLKTEPGFNCAEQRRQAELSTQMNETPGARAISQRVEFIISCPSHLCILSDLHLKKETAMRPERGSSSCGKQAAVKQQKHIALLQKAPPPPVNGPLHVSVYTAVFFTLKDGNRTKYFLVPLGTKLRLSESNFLCVGIREPDPHQDT